MNATANESNSPNILPPISMFTSRSNSNQQIFMPASPPSSGYDKPLKSLTLLPKPHHEESYSKERQSELLSPPLSSSAYYQKRHSDHSPSSSSSASYTPATTPDQHTLWALFNQFQQQQQQQTKLNANRYAVKEADSNRRSSDRVSLISTSDRVLTSEEVLAEKRRRNAGASARFRDRRKQRERELQDKCNQLEHRSKEFENALRRIRPDHPLLSAKQSPSEYDNQCFMTPPTSSAAATASSATSGYSSDQNTLFDRVEQLEHLMTRFKQEKETDVQKLEKLEKENEYLRSLLVPVSLPSASRRDSATDSDSSNNSHTSANNKRRQLSSQEKQEYNKRVHLFPSSHHSNDQTQLD